MGPERTDEELIGDLERMYHRVAGDSPDDMHPRGGEDLPLDPPPVWTNPAAGDVPAPEAMKEDLDEKAMSVPGRREAPIDREDLYDAPSSRTLAGESSRTASSGTHGSLRRRLTLAAAPFVLLVLAVFLWPTLYHVSAIRYGNDLFPLRIHRITGNAAFFDGKAWKTPLPVQNPSAPAPAPGPAARDVNPPASAAPVPPPDPEKAATPSTVKAEAVAELPRAVAKEGPPSAGTTDKPPETRRVTPPASPRIPPAPAPVAKNPAVPAAAPPEERPAGPEITAENKESTGAAAGKPPAGGAYVVQVSALKERDAADRAKTLLGEAGLPVHDAGQDPDSLYRIHVGPFATRDAAARFWKEQGLDRRYPGSFIRRTEPGGGAKRDRP